MVDKDAFEEIEENPWTDMEVTVMKGIGLTVGGWRLVVGDSWWYGGGWLCVNPT